MTTFAARGFGGQLRPVAGPALATTAAGVAACALSAGLVIALSLDAGGYFATAWTRTALGALAVVAATLVKGDRLLLERRDRVAIGAFVAWLVVVAAATMQPGAATTGVPEVERNAMYVVVFWAALQVLRRSAVVWCLGGLLIGIVSVTGVGLAELLSPGGVPDTYEGRLLYQPIGYANAMGALAAMGVVIALGFAARGPKIVGSAAAGSIVPLAVGLTLSGSRGATAALVIALALLVLADPGGRQVVVALLAVLPITALGVLAAMTLHVNDARVSRAALMHHGRTLAALVVVLTLANTALNWRLMSAARARQPLGHRRILLSAFVIVTLGGVALALPYAFGNRLPYWRAAWADVLAHPLLGSGPGTFAAAWLRYRDVPNGALDAHNVYLQTLAELGPLGFGALLFALLIPLTAARRAAQHNVYAPVAAAAYAVFLLHAAVDWDWQIPAVTLVALLLAVGVLVAARDDERPSEFPVSIAAAVISLAAAASCLLYAGNSALDRSSQAAAAQNWPAARMFAAEAAHLQPWSAAPLLVLGEAQAMSGEVPAARASFERAAALAPGDWKSWYGIAAVSDGQARRDALLRTALLVNAPTYERAGSGMNASAAAAPRFCWLPWAWRIGACRGDCPCARPNGT